MPPGALGAQPAENQLTLAKDALAERACGWLGDVIPLHILDIAAAVADEVVMPHAFRVESSRAALGGHFTHQTRLHQVPEIVISSGPGTARIFAIYSREDFRGGGMSGVLHQERHHGVALRSAPQSTGLQGPFNRLGVYQVFRLYLI